MSIEQLAPSRPPLIVVRLLAMNEAGDILAARRAKAQPESPAEVGRWELPGGKADRPLNPQLYPDTGYLAHNAATETFEETGLEVEVITPFRLYDVRTMRGGQHDGRLYHAAVALASVVGGTLRSDARENNAVAWVPQADVHAWSFQPDTRFAIQAIMPELATL